MSIDWQHIKQLCVQYGTEYSLKILAALAIFLVGKFAASMVRKIILGIGDKKDWDKSLYGFLSDIAYFALMVFVIVAALGKLGVQTNSFVAIIGAAGLAVGFALQGSLSNFAAGVMIVVFKPYKVGDYIQGGGAEGEVENIQIFNTVIKSLDNKTIIVQNANMTGGNIVNFSTEPQRRVDMVFGIGYGDDIDLAREAILEVLNKEDRILKDPEPQVAVSELADSSVNFVTRPWVKTEDYWDVMFAVTENVKKAFDAKGISIPFPQQDIHLHQVEKK